MVLSLKHFVPSLKVIEGGTHGFSASSSSSSFLGISGTPGCCWKKPCLFTGTEHLTVAVNPLLGPVTNFWANFWAKTGKLATFLFTSKTTPSQFVLKVLKANVPLI